jgi:predicted TIM-barrel fold metal-dependent hydrolase
VSTLRDGFRILDADRHVVEPYGLWDTYLDAEFRQLAPRTLPFFAATGRDPSGEESALAAEMLPMLVVAGNPIYRAMSPRAWAAIGRAARARRFAGPLDRPETHLAHMDMDGIDAAVLYPTFALLIEGMDTLRPQVASAFARAYNRWLKDFCARAPHRLLGAGLISVHDPEVMVPELTRVSKDGFRIVVLRPNPVAGRRLSHPAYAPFWAECEARSVAVVIHEGTHAYLPAAGAERFSSRFAQHACSHPMEQMIALLDLIEGGVFESHPRLRVAFLEAGCGWVPYWLWRLDSEYAHLSSEVASHVRAAPSSYFRRQAWVAAEPDEPYLRALLHFIGADRVLFGTDFPHVDHEEGLVASALATRPTLQDEMLRRYLWDNAVSFFGLEPLSSST